MGNQLSFLGQSTVKSPEQLAADLANVANDHSIEIGPWWKDTIKSLVNDHKKVAEQIAHLEKELLNLKGKYKHHEEIIMTAEHITRIIQEKQADHRELQQTSQIKISLKMDDVTREHCQFGDLIDVQEKRLSHMETEVKTHSDSIIKHNGALELLKEQLRQRKYNIKTQRVYINNLKTEFNKFGKKLQMFDKEYEKLKESSPKSTPKCDLSAVNARQETEEVQPEAVPKNLKVLPEASPKNLKKNTGRANRSPESEKTEHFKVQPGAVPKNLKVLPEASPKNLMKNTGRANRSPESEKTEHFKVEPVAVPKKIRKYAFALSKELTQAFQSLKSEKLCVFNSTADPIYLDEFVDILKEDIIGSDIQTYSPLGGSSAFDKVLVFGSCTLRVESDSNMALDKIPRGHRSKVILVMFHKTAGSKTQEEVYMYTFKHAEVAKQLHVPFKLNS